MTTIVQLPLDQQIKLLVEGRAPGEQQIEFAIFLIDQGVLSDASEAAAFIQAKRDYDRMKRENASDPVKRTPVAQQIIQDIESLRDRESGSNDPMYYNGLNDAISVAGRYV